jgi:regulator of replication initiation timing
MSKAVDAAVEAYQTPPAQDTIRFSNTNTEVLRLRSAYAAFERVHIEEYPHAWPNYEAVLQYYSGCNGGEPLNLSDLRVIMRLLASPAAEKPQEAPEPSEMPKLHCDLGILRRVEPEDVRWPSAQDVLTLHAECVRRGKQLTAIQSTVDKMMQDNTRLTEERDTLHTQAQSERDCWNSAQQRIETVIKERDALRVEVRDLMRRLADEQQDNDTLRARAEKLAARIATQIPALHQVVTERDATIKALEAQLAHYTTHHRCEPFERVSAGCVPVPEKE